MISLKNVLEHDTLNSLSQTQPFKKYKAEFTNMEEIK